jgi:tetratricopeptide (TPR) repeat protein
MAIDEKQRQKKLMKKTAKRKMIRAKKNLQINLDHISSTQATQFPIRDCLVPKSLFEVGIGVIILTRALPNGNIALSSFMVDVFCLGVKDAMYRIYSLDKFEEYIQHIKENTDTNFEGVHPSCLRKLIEGAVSYAYNLGFGPHSDYAQAAKLFGSIEAAACPVRYEYGMDGKPFYISGPNETPSQANKIIKTLSRKYGQNQFDYVAAAIGEHDIGIEKREQLEIGSYIITYDPLEDINATYLPEVIENEIKNIYNTLINDPQSAIINLKPIIEKYPNVPKLYNYLYNAYILMEDKYNAYLINEETLKKFPTYFFARITRALEYLEKGELDKISEIFDKKYDLKALYPNRDVFHISEATAFYSLMVKFFYLKGDIKQAKLYFDMLEKINPDGDDTSVLKNFFTTKKFSKFWSWFQSYVIF